MRADPIKAFQPRNGIDSFTVNWSEQMRAALTDPNQLRVLPPSLVCRIQREWLGMLNSLPESSRTRWYREMLGTVLRG